MDSSWATSDPFTTDRDDYNVTDDDVTSNATNPVTTPGIVVTEPPQDNNVAMIIGVVTGCVVLILNIIMIVILRVRRKKLETRSSYEEGHQTKDANVATADSTYEGLLPKAPTDDETYSNLNDFDPNDGVNHPPPRPKSSAKQKVNSDMVKNLVKMYENKMDGNDETTVDTVDDNAVYQNVPIEKKKKKKKRFTLSQKSKSSASPVVLVKYGSGVHGTSEEQSTEPITEDVYANAEQGFDTKPPLAKTESAEIYVNTPFP